MPLALYMFFLLSLCRLAGRVRGRKSYSVLALDGGPRLINGCLYPV